MAENGMLCQSIASKPKLEVSSVKLPKNLAKVLSSFPKNGKVHTIGVMPGELVTEHKIRYASEVQDGNLSYLAVIERHGKSGNIGLGFVDGLGMQSGAIASSVAHDSHNLIVAGKTIEDMEKAAQTIAQMGGGFAVIHNQEVIASVSLPLGGLMSYHSIEKILYELKEMEKATAHLGMTIPAPFMVLSFLALPVIPHLKLTDKGLVDVDAFSLIPLMA